jgi:hypothetical protein
VHAHICVSTEACLYVSILVIKPPVLYTVGFRIYIYIFRLITKVEPRIAAQIDSNFFERLNLNTYCCISCRLRKFSCCSSNFFFMSADCIMFCVWAISSRGDGTRCGKTVTQESQIASYKWSSKTKTAVLYKWQLISLIIHKQMEPVFTCVRLLIILHNRVTTYGVRIGNQI